MARLTKAQVEELLAVLADPPPDPAEEVAGLRRALAAALGRVLGAGGSWEDLVVRAALAAGWDAGRRDGLLAAGRADTPAGLEAARERLWGLAAQLNEERDVVPRRRRIPAPSEPWTEALGRRGGSAGPAAAPPGATPRPAEGVVAGGPSRGQRQREAVNAVERAVRALGRRDADGVRKAAAAVADLDGRRLYAGLPEASRAAAAELEAGGGHPSAAALDAVAVALGPGPLAAELEEVRARLGGRS